MLVLGLILGFIAGVFVTRNWDNISDAGSQLLDKLPDRDTVLEKAPAVGKFLLRRGWLIVLLVVFVAIVVVNLNKTPDVPVVKIGQPVEMLDGCGAKVIVRVTDQDVARGQIIIGAIQKDGKDCSRILQLGTTKSGGPNVP